MFWESASSGKYNPCTVVGGFDIKSRKKMLIARAMVAGEMSPGKIHDSHQCAYIPQTGKEVSVDTYEVLVNPQDVYLEWIVPDGHKIPTGAVVGGKTGTGEVTYIARAKHAGEYVPGKYVPTDQVCYIPWGGQEHQYDQFEVMCVNSVTPLPRVQ